MLQKERNIIIKVVWIERTNKKKKGERKLK